MKFDYIPKNDRHGTRYILRPSNPDGGMSQTGRAECRFLTILRDEGLLREGVVLKVIGAETMKTMEGLPPNPVSALGLEVIEPPEEDIPVSAKRTAHDKRDPNARLPLRVYGVSSGKKSMRVVAAPDKTKGS